MLSLPSQLLIRNLDIFDSGRWAIVNPTDPYIFQNVIDKPIVGLHQTVDVFKQVSTGPHHTHQCAASFQLDQQLDGAVIYLPKSKQHLTMLIDNMHALVKTNGQLLIVGENKAGIKSVAKTLEKLGGPVNKIDSAKHCGLLCGTKTQEANETFDLLKYGIIKTYEINGIAIDIFSLPGVFGHKQLDHGTKILLEQIPTDSKLIPKSSASALDFACGTGVIGTYLLKLNPQLSMTMSDVSSLATFCTLQTLKLNNVTANVIQSDGMSNIKDTFEFVISNPPFHAGIHTNYEITREFVEQAYKQIHRGGHLCMVANRFLPYADALSQCFSKSISLVKTSKFTVYQATK